MNNQQLEAYLHQQIPLTQHMQVSVKSYERGLVELAIPLAANSNLHGTAFGGSIGSIAILCGWTWLNAAATEAGIACDLVVQKTEMTYESAINEDFYARCAGTDNEQWQRFVHLLQRRRRSRIQLAVDVCTADSIAARLIATYAAKLN